MALSLSPLIRFGTSIWTYEGWQGQVYTRQYAKSTFARECLGEYCQYQYQGEPLFRTVENATFYRPPTTNQLRRYLNQIPQGVQMCFKVWEEITIPSYVLSDEEWGRLYDAARPHLQPVLLTAYQLGQRFGEITGLTWDRVDLKRGFITLRALDTKTKTARQVPMTPDVKVTLQGLAKVRSLATRHVFTYGGRPLQRITRSFQTALRDAGYSRLSLSRPPTLCLNEPAKGRGGHGNCHEDNRPHVGDDVGAVQCD